MNIEDIKIDNMKTRNSNDEYDLTKEDKSDDNIPQDCGDKVARDKKGRFLTRPKNSGRNKGSISLLTDIKKKLKEVKKNNPEEYQALIDYYWKNEKTRDLLIKMIDGLPKQKIEAEVKVQNYDWGKYKDNI